jgi:drug/metabolite transporter (DMT)-like permease
VQTIPAFLGVHITVFVGIPLLVISAAITGQLFDLATLSTKSYLLLAAAGLTQFFGGAYTLYRSFAAIGANRSTPIRSISVPFTLLMAVFLLGEQISAINGIGIVIVVLAPAIMFQREDTTIMVGKSKLLEGYVFALISGLAFGITPLLIREAIGGTGLGIAGALISYSACAGVLFLGLAWPGRLASLKEMDRTAVRWFFFTSFGLFIAHTLRFVAFDWAEVTVVEPLMRTAGIWTVIFAFLINRHLEAFGTRVLAAITLSIVGSVFVVL